MRYTKTLLKLFNNNYIALLQKTLSVIAILMVGMGFGVAFTLTVIGMTPDVFVDLVGNYNTSSIVLPFMVLAVLLAAGWQFVELANTDDVTA